MVVRIAILVSAQVVLIGASAPATQDIPVYIDGVGSDQERIDTKTLFDEAYQTLRSDAFRKNLLSLKDTYPRIYANPRISSVDAARIMDIIDLKEKDTRFIRMPISLVGGQSYNDASMFNYTARTGSTGINGDEPAGSMSLGRVNLYRYRQPDIVDKSCAINTAAHELSHAISDKPGSYRYAIMDTALSEAPDKTSAIASYLIGSVAQCTYLQQKGRVKANGLAACVTVFGTTSFNNVRCDNFSGGGDIL